MVQQNPASYNVRLAFCQSCGAAYLYSEGIERDDAGEPTEDNEPVVIGGRARLLSPCHGTEAILTYDLEGMFEMLNLLVEAEAARRSGAADGPHQEPAKRGRQRVASGGVDDASSPPPSPVAPPDSGPPSAVSDATAAAGDDAHAPGPVVAGATADEPADQPVAVEA